MNNLYKTPSKVLHFFFFDVFKDIQLGKVN